MTKFHAEFHTRFDPIYCIRKFLFFFLFTICFARISSLRYMRSLPMNLRFLMRILHNNILEIQITHLLCTKAELIKQAILITYICF